MDEPKIIDDFLHYKLLLFLGGLGSMAVGIVHLWEYFNVPQDQLDNLLIGLPSLLFGIVSLIVLLDQRAIHLSKDRIEIKSFFRKKVILKKDITGWGIEDYKMEYISGERIRIFSKEKSLKVFTSQYKSIDDVKEFVRGKPELILMLLLDEKE